MMPSLREIRVGDSCVRAREFVLTALTLMEARGRIADTHKLAQSRRDDLPLRVVEILKTASPGSFGSDAVESPSSWGSHLAPYEQVADAYLESLSYSSVFDASVSDMRQIPLRGRMPVIDGTCVGYIVGEGVAKTPSDIVLDAAVLDPLKGVAILYLSRELLRLSTTPALFNAEMTKALVKIVDSSFLGALIDATTPASSTGDPATDFAALLASISSGANARFYVATTPTVCKELACWPPTTFPGNSNMGPTGGTVAGTTVLATDAVDDGVMVAFDATQIIGNRGGITLDASEHATLDPSGGSTPTFSLWQRNCAGLRAERYFGYSIPRANAVASLSSVSYMGESPA